MKRATGVPTYVLQYLLGMYCSSVDTDAIAAGVSRISKILVQNYVRPDESEKIKSLIRERGQYTVIDKLSAYLDEKNDFYVATLTNLAIDPFVLPDDYVRKYTKILTGGIWCIMRIEYLHPSDLEGMDEFDEGSTRKRSGKKRTPADSPFHVVSLTPI